jgi:acetyltransferase-like isoleucine patch superfamily enzyme
VSSNFLHWADSRLFDWLMTNADAVPLRLKKVLAWHYPDARVRKLYWAELNVAMGEATFPNPGLLVVNSMEPDTSITIGDRVSIAPGVILVTDSAPTNSPVLLQHPRLMGSVIRKAPIVIEDDVWIGAGVVILPGVRVGRRAVIGAGAVVTSDVAPSTVVAGTPARLLRTLDEA